MHAHDTPIPEPTGLNPWTSSGAFLLSAGLASAPAFASGEPEGTHASSQSLDFVSMLFVFMLATFIGLGVIRRVSRLLHTPLMSLTNAISAIAVVGAIIVAGGEGYPTWIRAMGAVALFASMTNIVSGFMITDRMLRMFKPAKSEVPTGGGAPAAGGRP